jgi:four helix bundle protein
MQTYRDLIVWQKSVGLCVNIYDLTKQFPHDEVYGITSQIRRSSVSFPSNIAEGFGRNSQVEYVRFLKIASGSLYELQTQLEICCRIGYLNQSNFESLWNLSVEIEKMLSSLISKIYKSTSN